MTQTNVTPDQQYMESQQQIANLQSACNELEAQNRELVARSVRTAMERDNAIRVVKALEARMEELQKLVTESAIPEAELLPIAAAPVRKKTAPAVN